jgi:L-ribulose-5-phosphate 4-epimerase
LTWGNVSEREDGFVAIKPSGIPYEKMTADDIVVVDLDGKIAQGKFSPSSDLATHLEIYKAFKNIGGVAHTHSTYATIFAQRGEGLKCFGTTHADYFHGEIPVTRDLLFDEIKSGYEKNTGKVIIEVYKENCPAVLVKSHAPFTFGKSAAAAVENAFVLEEIAKMAVLGGKCKPISQFLIDKHYFRKHGSNAYYGQK